MDDRRPGFAGKAPARGRWSIALTPLGTCPLGSVERALRTVPRHRFVPDASVRDAYANMSITTKAGGPDERPASCVSTPTVVAMMLGQLDVRPGELRTYLRPSTPERHRIVVLLSSDGINDSPGTSAQLDNALRAALDL